MRTLLALLLAVALGAAGCQNEPKTSSAEDIARMRADIEKKRQEITDQKELARLEEESKRLDAELRQLNGGKQPVATDAQPTITRESSAPITRAAGGNTGTINGGSVIMRGAPSVQSDKVGTFSNGETVRILESRQSQTNNEAILSKSISLYTSNTGTGTSAFTLPKGKAVVIEQNDEVNHKLMVSYQHPEKGKLYAQISSDAVESIDSATWYHVKRSSGESGWVFGKFLKIN